MAKKKKSDKMEGQDVEQLQPEQTYKKAGWKDPENLKKEKRNAKQRERRKKQKK